MAAAALSAGSNDHHNQFVRGVQALQSAGGPLAGHPAGSHGAPMPYPSAEWANYTGPAARAHLTTSAPRAQEIKNDIYMPSHRYDTLETQAHTTIHHGLNLGREALVEHTKANTLLLHELENQLGTTLPDTFKTNLMMAATWLLRLFTTELMTTFTRFMEAPRGGTSDITFLTIVQNHIQKLAKTLWDRLCRKLREGKIAQTSATKHLNTGHGEDDLDFSTGPIFRKGWEDRLEGLIVHGSVLDRLTMLLKLHDDCDWD